MLVLLHAFVRRKFHATWTLPAIMVPPRFEIFLALVLLPAVTFLTQVTWREAAGAAVTAYTAAAAGICLFAFSAIWVIYINLIRRKVVFFRLLDTDEPSFIQQPRQSRMVSSRVAPEPPRARSASARRSRLLSSFANSDMFATDSAATGAHGPLRAYTLARTAVEQADADDLDADRLRTPSRASTASLPDVAPALQDTVQTAQEPAQQADAEVGNVDPLPARASGAQAQAGQQEAMQQPLERNLQAGNQETEDFGELPEYVRRALRSIVGDPALGQRRQAAEAVAEGIESTLQRESERWGQAHSAASNEGNGDGDGGARGGHVS